MLHYCIVLKLRPPGPPDHPSPLRNLVLALEIRFPYTGQTMDLGEAIKHCRGSLELCPLGHADHFGSLNYLAAGL